jgi:uncharacterized membrane protein YfhO
VWLLEETAGRQEFEADAEAPATLLVRDAWAPGWTVSVDGTPGRLERTETGHRAVALEPGRHRVEFAYRPPALLPGLAISAACALVVLFLVRPGSGARVALAAPV